MHIMKYPGISICMPAFNEENTLKESVEDLISTLSPSLEDLEIIIVNDGSTDSTGHLAEQLAKQYSQVRVIHHKKNMGIGVCYRDALSLAGYQYFTWFPADYENQASEFVQCLPYLDKNTIVTTHHRGGDPRSNIRRFISRMYVLIFNTYFNLHLKYYNGLTVFPVSILRSVNLVSNGFAIFAESIIKTLRCGCKLIELTAPLNNRSSGKSKALTPSSLARMYRDFIGILRTCSIKSVNVR